MQNTGRTAARQKTTKTRSCSTAPVPGAPAAVGPLDARRGARRPALPDPDRHHDHHGQAAGGRGEEERPVADAEPERLPGHHRADDDAEVHRRPRHAEPLLPPLLRQQVGDHRVARRLEERPAERALQGDERGHLPELGDEGEAHEPDDADEHGDHDDHAPPEPVRELPAPELHRHHGQRHQAEDHADHRHRRAQVLAQVDGLEREGQGGGADVDEDAERQHPELAGEVEVASQAGEHGPMLSERCDGRAYARRNHRNRRRRTVPAPARSGSRTCATLLGKTCAV